MAQYIVTGMTCAACQAHVEKAVAKVPGVDSVSVSLLTNSMSVDGSANQEAIIEAIANAGYGAERKDIGAQKMRASDKLAADAEALKDKETPKLMRRLVWSAVFLAVLMYITMGHNMFGWQVPSVLDHNHLGLAMIQMLIAICVMLINHAFFVSGFKSLLHASPNMDTLVALGSSVSFGWSLYILLKMTWFITNGGTNDALMPLYHEQLYFESAAMIPALITVGKTLESLSKGRTTDALKNLMRMAPKKAVIEREGLAVEVDIDDVVLGDIFLVKPGASIPVDGVILEGTTAIDESALTGESIPIDKGIGDTVSAATINQSGFIKARAMRVGEDTTFSQIIQMVSEAAGTKAPIARIADKVSGVFVPAVIGIAVLVLIVWIFLGVSWAMALERAISVLVISCPCALGLATPVAIMVGNGVGAKNGILFKTSEALEVTGKIQIIALDKTGTITEGKPAVTDILPADNVEEVELLEFAYALEKKSEHPLAKAILTLGNKRSMSAHDVSDFKALSGHGLEGKIAGQIVHGGSNTFISSLISIPEAMKEKANSLAEAGKTPLFFERAGQLLGIIAVADVIKSDSAQAIKELQGMGLEVVMLTGDNVRTAKTIGEQAGVNRVIAEVLPEGKDSTIQSLQKRGKVAMVGDGINDAPALTRSNIGIAIGAGTDVAIDSADIVLMNSKLTDVAAAIRLSRATLKNIHENLFWAFGYNVLLIPVAAGVYRSLQINPMWAAAAMALSSFTVCMNALRLNLFDIHKAHKDKPMRHSALPDTSAEKVIAVGNSPTEQITACPIDAEENKTAIIQIGGMMCEHCEKRVKKALEAIDGIISATPNFRTGTVTILYTSHFNEPAIQQAITDAEYEYISIKKSQGGNDMTKTVKIEGMMCGHCEAAVKKALEALDGVESADVSHEKDTAVLTLTKDVAEEVIKKTIEEKDYKFIGIE